MEETFAERDKKIMKVFLKIVLVLTLAFLTHCGSSNDQENSFSTGPLPLEGEDTLRLFTHLGVHQGLEAHYLDWGMAISYTNGWIIKRVSEEEGCPGFNWDQDRTDYWLERVPENFEGPLVPDWEGDCMRVLADGPGAPGSEQEELWQQTLDKYLDLLTYLQRKRPSAKVGYYGLPTKKYWGQDDAWRNSMRALRPLFELQNAIYVSIYDFYDVDDYSQDHEHWRNIVLLALEVAHTSGDKPVIMYSTHRFHNSTPNGFKLVDRVQYLDHIHYLLNVEHAGTKPFGVLMWGGDDFYYDNGLCWDEEWRCVETDEQGNCIRYQENWCQPKYGEGGYAYWNRVRNNFRIEMNEYFRTSVNHLNDDEDIPEVWDIDDYLLHRFPIVFDRTTELLYPCGFGNPCE